MANRTRDYYRKARAKSIRYRKGVVRSFGFHPIWDEAYESGIPFFYKYSGQFSKGKIHCSCPLCRHQEPKHQDKRNLLSMEQKLFDFAEDGMGCDCTAFNSLENRIKKERNKREKSVNFHYPGTRIRSDRNYDHPEWDEYFK